MDSCVEEGIEYCGMLCQQPDEHVLGTFHTHRIGPLNEANPRRPFSEADILDGTEPYDFVAQALAPRTKSGLDVHVYMFERGIQTECQIHPTVICPFPPIHKGPTP